MGAEQALQIAKSVAVSFAMAQHQPQHPRKVENVVMERTQAIAVAHAMGRMTIAGRVPRNAQGVEVSFVKARQRHNHPIQPQKTNLRLYLSLRSLLHREVKQLKGAIPSLRQLRRLNR